MVKTKSNLLKIKNIYYLRYKVNGKQIKKSLKTSNLKQAENRRNELLTSVKDIKTESDVIQKVARAKNIYNPKNFLLNRVISEFAKHPVMAKPSPTTPKVYSYWIQQFLNWLDKKHSEIKLLSDISADIAKEYSTVLYSKGISHKTYNETLNTIARVFDVFKEQAGLSDNPFSKEHIARLAKNPVSRKELSKEQILYIFTNFKKINISHGKEYELLFYLGS